jgi:hemoglobin
MAHMAETVQRTDTHFSRLGGAPAVDRIVEAFYRRMDTLPEARTIRAMHLEDLAPTKAILKDYLGEWLGGPLLYSQKRGHPRLRMRHTRFAIGPAERDAWMLCMRSALADAVPDKRLREHIEKKLYQLADWVRNDEDNPHDNNRDKNH